ncbi:spore cortex-lytic enzyme [Metabacillus sp. RGM 3146]|uniref:spore cortex-lytic enzyme n=1 Tax=Metabacillus sp. RGM 3146 TaxID=3401092 RepID=UPI003B990F94
MRSARKVLWIIALTFSMLLLTFPDGKASAFTPQIMQRGTTGDDVIELQARLQYIGYYNGKIDGVYGWSTYWAVRKFQNQFKLKERDGLVGYETKRKLVDHSKFYDKFVYTQILKGRDFTHYGGVPLKDQMSPSKQFRSKMRAQAYGQRLKKEYSAKPGPSKSAPQNTKSQAKQSKKKKAQGNTSVNMPAGFSQNDIKLMANAVYGESRGEPYIGQVAVASVILNRIASPKFPDTVSGVIFEPGAFTAVADGQIWLTPNQQAKKAVIDAINGWDPTENALYYFNPDTATSGWIWGRPQIKQIGKHIFCE